VSCSCRKRFLSQPPLGLLGERAARAHHLVGDRAVIAGRGNHRNILKILCCRPDHRRAADIDVFNQLLEVRAQLGGSLFEGIQVDYHHVDSRDAMLGHRCPMTAVLAAMQDPAVNFRMQRLDAPVQHFREPGQLGDISDGDAGVAQQLGRAASRNQFHAKCGKAAGKIYQSGFVSDAKNGTLDSRHEDLGSEEALEKRNSSRRGQLPVPNISLLPYTHKYEIITHWRLETMRTNIDIDDGLMRQALRRSGVRTKKAAVEAGLRLLVATYAQQSIRRLKGKVQWEGDLNASRRGRIAG